MSDPVGELFEKADAEIDELRTEVTRLRAIINGLPCRFPTVTADGVKDCIQLGRKGTTYLPCAVCKAKLEAVER